MAVTAGDLRVCHTVNTETGEVEGVDGPRLKVGHTAAEHELEQGLRQRTSGLNTLIDTDGYISHFVQTETEVKQAERHITADIGHAVQLAQESVAARCRITFYIARVERCNRTARLRVYIQYIADRERVITETHRGPAQRSEVHKSLTNRLECRVEGMTHGGVLQEVNGVHLLSACGHTEGRQEGNHNGFTNVFHCSALLIFSLYRNSTMRPHVRSDRYPV